MEYAAVVAIKRIFKNHLKSACKRVKVIQRCSKIIYQEEQKWALLLHFKRKLPKPFPQGKKYYCEPDLETEIEG